MKRTYYLILGTVILAVAHHNIEEKTVDIYDAFVNQYEEENIIYKRIIESFKETVSENAFFFNNWTDEILLKTCTIVPSEVYAENIYSVTLENI
jgi:hypothetical protein